MEVFYRKFALNETRNVVKGLYQSPVKQDGVAVTRSTRFESRLHYPEDSHVSSQSLQTNAGIAS